MLAVLFTDNPFDTKWVVKAGWAYLWGWVSLTILGYLSKIVPLLWWTHKYGGKVGKTKIPTMSDLFDERTAIWGLSGIAAGIMHA